MSANPDVEKSPTIADAMDSHLLTRVEDGVAIAVLNRPDRRNALSQEMLVDLAHALAAWESDDAVGAVVIAGAGTAFCAGGDVKGFAARGGEAGGSDIDPQARIERQVAQQRATVGRLYQLRKPTVAVLPGPAAGAGLGLALACDFRIGSSRANLVAAFAGVALSGDYGATWLLTRMIGGTRARRALLLGEPILAEQALDLGLLDRVVADPMAEGVELARSLATGPRLALAHLKANLLDAENLNLFDAMDREVPRHQACGATADHREAAHAFVDKRKPIFGGAL